ncbi:hypothetical protein B0H17DRAFT_1125751 [Mycena rosella]|uniref:Uncharacterized protein n=1 Tax=Mycena rosella TaxID=1033263 RepID=A0AAD7M9I6_MYCRO|nr:hypothetical protein B0H17DRAFT_1125751 [Mycena rosella]
MVGTLSNCLHWPSSPPDFFACASPAPALVTVVGVLLGNGSNTDSSTDTGKIAEVGFLGRTTHLSRGVRLPSYTAEADLSTTTFAFGDQCALKDGNIICTELDANAQPATKTFTAKPEMIDLGSPSGFELTSTTPSGGASNTALTSGPTNRPNSSQNKFTSTFEVLVGLALVYQLV